MDGGKGLIHPDPYEGLRLIKTAADMRDIEALKKMRRLYEAGHSIKIQEPNTNSVTKYLFKDRLRTEVLIEKNLEKASQLEHTINHLKLNKNAT